MWKKKKTQQKKTGKLTDDVLDDVTLVLVPIADGIWQELRPSHGQCDTYMYEQSFILDVQASATSHQSRCLPRYPKIQFVVVLLSSSMARVSLFELFLKCQLKGCTRTRCIVTTSSSAILCGFTFIVCRITDTVWAL